jgi:hypothetical protein
MMAALGGEEPLGMAMGGPVEAEELEGAGRQRDEAILVSLAAADMDQQPLGVDVGDLQMEGLLQAEAEE